MGLSSSSKKTFEEVSRKNVKPSEITLALFNQYTALGEFPDPDFCIRTGGEKRLSNFLLWQFAYTELYFSDCFWPDFDVVEFKKSLADLARGSAVLEATLQKYLIALHLVLMNLRISPMLKQRLITGITLLVGFISITVGSSVLQYASFVTIIVAIGAWEWARLAALEGAARVAYVSVFLVVLVSLGVRFGLFKAVPQMDVNLLWCVVAAAALAWLTMFLFVLNYPKNEDKWNTKFRIGFIGFLTLGSTWAGIIFLKTILETGELVLMLMISVAAVDVGGFFVGTWFGKRSLAPHLSPKKSWEGVWGGLVLNILVAICCGTYANFYIITLEIWHIFVIALMSVLVTIFSVTGDLLESMLKRNCGLKDSGNILPGHGGALDRIDGLIAATPTFVIVVLIVMSTTEVG